MILRFFETLVHPAAHTLTHVIHGVSATYGWRGWPCSARVPEMLVGSDGTSQRLRTRISLQVSESPGRGTTMFSRLIHWFSPAA